MEPSFFNTVPLWLSEESTPANAPSGLGEGNMTRHWEILVLVSMTQLRCAHLSERIIRPCHLLSSEISLLLKV
jgi:hypothetical protein